MNKNYIHLIDGTKTLTNSLKDIPAYFLFNKYKDKKKTLLIESNGNFAISFSYYCNIYKIPLVIVASNISSKAKEILNKYNSKIIEFNNKIDAHKHFLELSNNLKYFPINQFNTLYNPFSYTPLISYIIKKYPLLDICIVGIGSGGLYYAINYYLKKLYPNIKIIGVLPSDEISGLNKDIKNLVSINNINKVYVSKINAINYIKTNNLNVGLSTGAVMYAIDNLKCQKKHILAFIIDDYSKYE